MLELICLDQLELLKKNVHLFLYVYLERSSCQSVVCTHYASTTIINDLSPPLPSVHDVYNSYVMVIPRIGKAEESVLAVYTFKRDFTVHQHQPTVT